MSFGADLADRVQPRVTVARPLGGSPVGRLSHDVCRFGSRIGLSYLQRQQLDLRQQPSAADLTVRPPIDWWPWPDEEPAPVHQPSVQAIVPSGDRKLDTLRRMLAQGTSARPSPAGSAGSATSAVSAASNASTANRDWRPPRRGLPRGVRRSATTAGPGTVPGALVERMQPETVDPQAVSESNAARLRGSQPRPASSAGDRQPRPDDKVNRLRRMLEKSGRIPPSTPDASPAQASSTAVSSSMPSVARRAPVTALASPSPTSSTVAPESETPAGVASPFGRGASTDEPSDPPGAPPTLRRTAVASAVDTTPRPSTAASAVGVPVAGRSVPTGTVDTVDTVGALDTAVAAPAVGPSALPLATLVRRTAADRAVAPAVSSPLPAARRPLASSAAPVVGDARAVGTGPLDTTAVGPAATRSESPRTAVPAGAWVPSPGSPVVAASGVAERRARGVAPTASVAPRVAVVQRTPSVAPSSRNQSASTASGRAGSFVGVRTAPAVASLPAAAEASTTTSVRVAAPVDRAVDVPLPGFGTDTPVDVADPSDVAATLRRTMDDAPRPLAPVDRSDPATSAAPTVTPVVSGSPTTSNPRRRSPRSADGTNQPQNERVVAMTATAAAPLAAAAISDSGSATTPNPRRISPRSADGTNQPQNVVRRRTSVARPRVAESAGGLVQRTVATTTVLPAIDLPDTSVTAPPTALPPHLTGARTQAAAQQPTVDVGARFLGELARSPRATPRPLPTRLQPLATAIAGDRPVRLSTDTASRAALASVGKVAATTGDVVHLQRMPTTAADHAVFAHELVHAAHPSPQPRFFDDDRPSAEERQAEQVAQIIRRAPVLPRASAAAEPRLQRMPVAPMSLAPRPASPATPSIGPTEPGTVSAAALAARLTGAASGGGSGGGVSIQRTPAPSIQREVSTSATIRRALGDYGPSGGSVGSSGSSDAASDFPYDLSASERRRFVQWLVENLGDRMLEELERRGGRFRGEF